MLNTFTNKVTGIIDDDLRASRLLFTLVGTSFLVFGLFGANAPLIGPFHHRILNFIPSGIGYLFLLLTVINHWAKTHATRLVEAYIYVINIINVYLLYATCHMDMYSYQFIIGYIVSVYFFHTKNELTAFVAVINAGVILTALTPHTGTKSPLDFYMTYIVCQGVFALLFRYRFGIEAKLKESEKKYRLLAENSFDLICVHDKSACLQFVSPSIKRLLGYDPESLVGTYPISLTHPEDEETMRAVNFRDPECPFVNKPIQFRLRNAGGEYIWFETIFTLIDEPGEKDGFILSQSRDISWRKQYQTALEERGRELERSNADLETFAFVSSHDIQEPLRMISNYTQLLKKRYKGQLDKDADEYIEYANRGAVHLQQLLRDLLSYSRITRSEIKAVPMDLNNLMVGLIKNIGLEIDEKKAKVVYGTLPYITSDPNLVMLVIQNLILNGIKYNRSENPEVVITTVTKPREIVFCFADNGIGIDIAHQQRVFEPFQRLHTKAEYPGTGLGLSICKKIVERLGGKMWLESEPGKGSKFYFTIPLN